MAETRMDTSFPVVLAFTLGKSGFPRTHTGILKMEFLAHVMTRVRALEKSPGDLPPTGSDRADGGGFGYDAAMCSNYHPVSRSDRLLSFFGVTRHPDAEPADCWPTGLAPFIRLAESGQRVVDTGHFGLLAHFETEVTAGRRTYNARCETVHSKPSYRDAWRRGQRCIVPVEWIYEPNWETGKAVRWKIWQPGSVPLGVAGIYTHWKSPDGRHAYSFSMITCNADGHPVMARFHKPQDEKRMVVILAPADYEEWLTCSADDAKRFFRQWPGPLLAEPAPLAPRGAVRAPKPPEPDAPDLFR